MTENAFIKISQLIEQKKEREALNELHQIKPQSMKDELVIKIHKINILSRLKKMDEAVNLITDNLFVQAKDLKLETELINSITSLVSILRAYDRASEGFLLIEKGEDLLNNVQNQNVQNQNYDYFKSLSVLLTQKGLLYWRKGEVDLALSCLQKNLAIQKELTIDKDHAFAFLTLGLVYLSKGDLIIALDHFKESLTIYQKIGDKYNAAIALNNIGVTLQDMGMLDQAIDYYKQSLEINEELGNKPSIGKALNNIGEIYREKGELITALEYFKRSLEIKKGGSKNSLAFAYDNIGRTNFRQGDLEDALQNHKKALRIRKGLGEKLYIAYSLNELGRVLWAKGELKKGKEHFLMASALFREVGNEIYLASSLYNLVILSVENTSINDAKEYLRELKQINTKEENVIVNQQYRLAQATIHKTSKRLRKKIEAQRFFEEVASEKIAKHSLTVFAMLNLCEMLLFELRTMEGEKEVLAEFKTLSSNILVIAKEQHSYSLLVQIYLLQSKVALLELDLHRAELLLAQARLTAEEKGLWKLVLILSNETDALRLQLDKWKDLSKRNASILERMELAQVNSIIKQMIQKRVEDINVIPRFAAEQIRISLFKMSMTGPVEVLSESLPFIEEDEKSVLNQMALLYIVSLGQGQSTAQNKGRLFGPLPIPTVPDHIGIAYAFFIKDPEYTDPRCNGVTYAVIVFSMSRSMEHFFHEREKIATIIENELEPISEIKEIDLEFLESLKYHILGLEKQSKDKNGKKLFNNYTNKNN